MARRSTQLIIESAVIGALLIGIAIGGVASNESLPSYWVYLQNPESATTSQNMLSQIALAYNITLFYLGNRQFTNVTTFLGGIPFLNIPSNVNATVSTGDSEIASMNVSIPLAIQHLGNAKSFIELSSYANASSEVESGCSYADKANLTFSQFKDSTTPSLSSLGVPVSLYSVGMDLVGSEISSLETNCTLARNQLSSVYPAGLQGNQSALNGNQTLVNGKNPPGVNFTIYSPQKSIVTGGNVLILGNLVFNNTGISGQQILFYFNGTFVGTNYTGMKGEVDANLSIPFVYSARGVILAFAPKNATTGFAGASSNELYFSILFNETNIVFYDSTSSTTR